MADDPRTFDELMARMGVQKLGRENPRNQPGPLETARPKARAAPVQPVVAKPVSPPVVAKPVSLEKELAEANATIATLRAELEEARRPPSDPSALTALLEARGIRGADESRELLQALAKARSTDPLLAELTIRRPDRVARYLADRVLLSCGRAECPTLPGTAILAVPPERCDACGGADIERARRRFQDACLVNGILLVGLVGGLVRDQRLLERASTHHRLALRVFASPVDAKAAGAQLVVAWNVPVEAAPRVIATRARNALAVMDEVAESLLP